MASSLWAIILATFAVRWHGKLLEPRFPLVVAIAAALAAWACSLWSADTAPPVRRRWLAFTGLTALLVLGLNVLMLAQPSPPKDTFTCLSEVPMGKGFRHFLNCDSLDFLILANNPITLPKHAFRESRPLSFVSAYLVARPLHLVRPLMTMGPYQPFSAEFVAYALINLALLTVTLLMFRSLLEGTYIRAGTEMLFAFVVLGLNDVSKMFFWTPHVQVYNLFVGCLTLYLCVWMIERATPLTARQGIWLGLALSAGVLIYGAFLIPVLCVVLIQVLFYRRLLTPMLHVGTVVVPYAAWAAILVLWTGRFYSHEIEQYRQFVWMADCVRLGAAQCRPIIYKNLWSFFNTAATVLVVPFAILGACRVAGLVWEPRVPIPRPRLRALGLGIAFAFSITGIFLLTMGFYSGRLIWLMVPPVILAIALELMSLRLSTARPKRWIFDSGVLLASLVYIFILLKRQGPYN